MTEKFPRQNVLWLIENAPTEELLIDVLKFSTTVKGAAPGLRKRWAEAVEARYVHLVKNPPEFEKITVAEAAQIDPVMHQALIDGQTMPCATFLEVQQWVTHFRAAECAKMGVTSFEDQGGHQQPAEVYFAEPIEVPEERLPVLIPKPINDLIQELTQS